MLFDQALSYLLSLGHETLSMKLGLSNTETLLQALGSPQKSFPAVQVAGTNGKGSTAVMVDSICRAAGIRSGLFTSPHLVSIAERIQVEGHRITESKFGHHTDLVKATAQRLVESGKLIALPTFFEHVTAIALLAFQEAGVELAILETGLGGRLDSTTVAGAKTIAITPIAMDHEEYLGHSLAAIAGEKAAIIRPGVTAVIAPQQPEAMEIISSQCRACNVDPILIAEPSAVDEGPLQGWSNQQRCDTAEIVGLDDGHCLVNFRTSVGTFQNVRLGLRGRHQVTNAAVAIAIAESLLAGGFNIDRAAIRQGIQNATHAGRLEMTAGSPRILFDGAHNPAAARALSDYLNEFATHPLTIVFGAMQDKALGEMAAALFPLADQLVLTEFNNPRAAALTALKGLVSGNVSSGIVHESKSSAEAMRLARHLTPPGGMICVTGSLYLIGEIQKEMTL